MRQGTARVGREILVINVQGCTSTSRDGDDALALSVRLSGRRGDAPGRPLYLNRFAIPPQVDAAAVHLRKQGPGAVIFAATVVVGNLDLVFPQLRLIKGLKFLKFLA